jgi:hypothetical protein
MKYTTIIYLTQARRDSTRLFHREHSYELCQALSFRGREIGWNVGDSYDGTSHHYPVSV